MVDALCFAVALLFAVLTFIDSPNVSQTARVIDLVLGAVSCVGVWWRRRWPVLFAVTTGLFGVYSSAAAGVGLLALFNLAVRRPFRIVGPVVAGFALVSVVSLLVRPDQPVPEWPMVLLGIVCTVAMLAWGLFIRARRQLVESLRERARQAEYEQELQVARARQLERDQIAREMHDVLAHRISLLSLHAGALELRPDAPATEIARSAGVIRESAHQVLEDLRGVIGVLRAGAVLGDEPERPQPTLADLPALIEESRVAGMRVELEAQAGDLAAVPAGLGRTAYRILQEGLTNARKHAPGTLVAVTVRGALGDGLTVEVRNPCSATPATAIPGTGTGLIGLTERADLAGGSLDHGRTGGDEFRLRAWLPWPA